MAVVSSLLHVDLVPCGGGVWQWYGVVGDPDVVILASCVNQQLQLALQVISARAGGALLLLGVGTLICYRLVSRRSASSYRSPARNNNNSRSGDGRGADGSGWRQLLARWRQWWRTRRCDRILAEYNDPLRESSDAFAARYFGPVDTPLSPTSPAWTTATPRGRYRKRNVIGTESALGSFQFVHGAALQSRPLSVNSDSRDSTPYQADCSASFSTDEQQSLSECDVCSTSPCCCSPVVTSSSTLMGNKCVRRYDTVQYNRDSTDIVFTQLHNSHQQLPHPLATGASLQPSSRVISADSSCPDEEQSRSLGEQPDGCVPSGVDCLPRAAHRHSLPPPLPLTALGEGRTADSSSCTPPASSSSRRRLQRRLSGVARSGGSLRLSVGELSQLCRHPTPPPASLPPLDVFSGVDSDGEEDWLEDEEQEVSWPDALGVNTAELLEQLQQQLELLKDDVSCLDTELVTLHFPHCLTGGATSGSSGPAKWKLASIGRSQSEYHVQESIATTPSDSPRDVGGLQPPSISTVAAPCLSSAGLSDCNVTDASLEWDSPSHGWAPLSRTGARQVPSGSRGPRHVVLARSVSLQNASLPAGVSAGQGECDLPSLEWDHSGIVQYTDIVDEDEEDGARLQTALELDMECELLTATEVMTSERASLTSLEHHVTSTPCRPSSLVLADIGSVSGLDTSGYEGTDPDTRNTSGAQSEVTPPSQLTSHSHLDSAVSSCNSTTTNNNNSAVAAATLSDSSSSVMVPLRRRHGSGPGQRGQRDSAYWDDGLDTERVCADCRPGVSQPVCLLEYGRQQWAGDTPRADTIRAGYCRAARDLHLDRVQLVRGDNYCAVRAALYQLVAVPRDSSTTFLSCEQGVARCLETLDGMEEMERWTFASRLSFSSVRDGIVQCLNSIADMMKDVDVCECDCTAWRNRLCSVWNSDPEREIRLMEAVKLHMLATATQLYHHLQSSQHVPEFVGLLFARDTSPDPISLMVNHLNQVGDTAGLEQVDMCLLAETLGVSLRVIRPSAHGQHDFVTYFPPRQPEKEESAVLTLLAEDDRHYNIAFSS